MEGFGSNLSLLQYTVNQFLNDALPPFRRGMNVRKILGELRKGKTPAITNGRWSWFQEDPSQTGKDKTTTFKPLEKIAEAICTASGLDGKYHKLLHFKSNPDGIPLSGRRASTFRPDGYLHSKVQDGETPSRWCDIALSAEYNLHDNEATREDIMIRVAWSMRQCLREDPCLRFTYGLTIEDTDARLWFCSRSGALVSEPFNFITDCHIMVEFFLRLMYAEKHEVGWDPTIERVEGITSDDNAQPCYDINMRTENGDKVTFRTVEILSDIGANPLRGRGTRVWKVKKLVNGDPCGDHLVLKDCWIYSNLPREGDIMREIRQSGPPDDEFHDYLLTVVCHGDVHIYGEPDDTYLPISRDGRQCEERLSDFDVEPELPDEASTIDPAYPTPTGTRGRTAPAGRRKWLASKLPADIYTLKTHYRIVFAEVCQPLHSLTWLNKIYEMLSKTTRALQGLHERGWVHRDVSTGNLLIYNDGIKLSDFEFARKMDDIKGHEIQTGTADFIACEVESRKYLFTQRKTIVLNTNDDFSSRVNAAAFRYNPLHDLESVWWIANFFTFNKGIVRIGESPQSYDQTPQLQVADGVFYSRTARLNLLCSGDLTDEIGFLHDLIRPAVQKTEFIQTALCERYAEVEKDPQSISGTAADGLHQPIASAYSIISIMLPEDTIIGDFFIPKKQETRVSPLLARRSNRALPGRSGQGQEKGKHVDTGDETESSVVAEPDQIKIPKQKRTKQPKSREQGFSGKSRMKAQSVRGGEASSCTATGLRKSVRLANAKRGHSSRLG